MHYQGLISHLHRQYFKKNTPPITLGGVNYGNACKVEIPRRYALSE